MTILLFPPQDAVLLGTLAVLIALGSLLVGAMLDQDDRRQRTRRRRLRRIYSRMKGIDNDDPDA